VSTTRPLDRAAALARLGLPADASAREVRRAFRRRALREHPDRNPGDSGADARFAALLAAYRVAARRPAVARPSPAPIPAAPLTCPGCGDGFTQRGRCGRCDLPAVPRASVGPAPADPRVDAYVAHLERPARRARPPWLDRAPLGPLLAAAFLGGGAFFWWLGPVAPAALTAGFGAYLASLATYRRRANAVSGTFRSGHPG
jgi:hypothetical protein